MVKRNLEQLKTKISASFRNREIKRMWLNIEEANQQMINLTETLAKLAIFNFEKITIRPEIFNLSNLIDEILGKIKPEAAKKRIKVKFEDKDDQGVFSDKLQIELIVTTILRHLINHLDKGSTIKISVRVDEDEIKISISGLEEMFSTTGMDDLEVSFAKMVTEKLGGKIVGNKISLPRRVK